MVKSLAEWDGWSQNFPPFSRVSQDARDRFRRELEFCAEGICSFYYGDMKRELSAHDFSELMNALGINIDEGLNPSILAFELDETVNMAELQKRLEGTIKFRFLTGYKCQGRGSCQKLTDYACTSNCVA